MSYDEIFEAAGINCFGTGHDCHFTWADVRRLVDYFVEKPEDLEIKRTLVLCGYIIRKVCYKRNERIVVHEYPPLPGKPQFGELHSEVAAFQPTEEGWAMAIQFVSIM
jgi:hypothetical protein